jgi:hypothetical protein
MSSGSQSLIQSTGLRCSDTIYWLVTNNASLLIGPSVSIEATRSASSLSVPLMVIDGLLNIKGNGQGSSLSSLDILLHGNMSIQNNQGKQNCNIHLFCIVLQFIYFILRFSLFV